MTAPRVLYTGQAVVDLVLRVESLPPRGGEVFASHHDYAPGGGFNVMAAAARDAAAVHYLGGHGIGPFGDRVRAAMAEEGIWVSAPPDTAQDTGFSVAIVDEGAERTFVSTVGAEGQVDLQVYRESAPRPGDVVHVSGYSMLHAANRAALLAWLPDLEDGVHVVVDPAPVIDQLPAEHVAALVSAATVWSCNEREAELVARHRGAPPAPSDSLLDRARALAVELRRTVVLRAGPRGAVLAEWDEKTTRIVAATEVPGLLVHAVDTNGAGDAHSGVLCAALAAGVDLASAVRRATVAASIAVTRWGPATGPMRGELDSTLADLRISPTGTPVPGLPDTPVRDQ